MSKIVVVGANYAGTACINTMLDNFGHENEIVVFDQNLNISFLGCGMTLWIGEQIDGPEGLFYSDKETLEAKDFIECFCIFLINFQKLEGFFIFFYVF